MDFESKINSEKKQRDGQKCNPKKPEEILGLCKDFLTIEIKTQEKRAEKLPPE